jgi:hypothetical protein
MGSNLHDVDYIPSPFKPPRNGFQRKCDNFSAMHGTPVRSAKGRKRGPGEFLIQLACDPRNANGAVSSGDAPQFRHDLSSRHRSD